MKNSLFKYLLFLPLCLVTLAGCGNGGGGGGTTSQKSSSEKPSITIPGDIVQETYSNPVTVKNQNNQEYTAEVADPSIFREGENFYLFATNCVVLKSQDMCTWKEMKKVPATMNWAKDEVPQGTSFQCLWAPDVIKVEDTYFYYYSVSTSDPWGWSGIGYMTSKSIEGPWTNESKLFWGRELNPGVKNCIDPMILEDDGRYYCYVGSFVGEFVVELEIDAENEEMKPLNYNATLFSGKDNNQWTGSEYEGSYVVKKDEYYYYFGSQGTCCYSGGGSAKSLTYRVITARGTSPVGPFYDENGQDIKSSWMSYDIGTVVVQKDGLHTWAPGHNSVFVDDAGDWWLIYHAYTTKDNLKTRHLMMDKLEWNDNDFPYVDGSKEKSPSFDEERDGPWIFNPF